MKTDPHTAPLLRHLSRALACILIVLCVAALVACGKKNWPESEDKDERFKLEALTVRRVEGQCLDVRALVRGKAANLGTVWLELAPAEGDGYCEGCPFDPAARIAFAPDAAARRMSGNRLALYHCPEGLLAGVPLRVRLTAKDTEGRMAPALTRAVTVP